MKFTCDRCKTRYSIGDERVRGKILKIRCKSCSNVITVREGMTSPDAAEPAPAGPGGPRRAHRTTTMAPAIQSEAPAPPAAAMAAPAPVPVAARPPPALQEEWYVSLDGDQAGPFALAEAQRWVAARPFDADLFCWSEGFDDWLPVDKVSHFRGLRRKPAPATVPPPLPRAATGALRAVVPRSPPEDEPKPLFAATMARLEKDSAVSELRRLAATPQNGRANGAAAIQARARPPQPMATPAPLAAPAHIPTQPGLGAKGPLPAFDASELGDGETEIEMPSFDAGGDTTAPAPRQPPAELAASAAGAAAVASPAAGLGLGLGLGLDDDDDDDDDDDLDIGEVSRVVKLADLSRSTSRPMPIGTPAPVAPRAAGPAILAAPRFGDLPPGPFAGGAADAAAFLRDAPAPLAAPPPAAASHRRAVIALIAGALVLVGVAVAVVIFVLAQKEESTGRVGLGTVEEIDTTRPEEVVRGSGSGSGGGEAPPITDPGPTPDPLVPRPTKKPAITPSVAPPVNPELPTGLGARLEAREIEAMAGKHSSLTQRCYMRAQRGADGILVGDVKKISVTLTINGEGLVTEAQLSDNHAQNALGKCLIASIKTWRFRTSPGGTFRFVLHFG